MDDECGVVTERFVAFTVALTGRHWNSNNPVLRDLLAPIIGINLVLIDRAGESLAVVDLECRKFWMGQLERISSGMPRG